MLDRALALDEGDEACFHQRARNDRTAAPEQMQAHSPHASHGPVLSGSGRGISLRSDMDADGDDEDDGDGMGKKSLRVRVAEKIEWLKCYSPFSLASFFDDARQVRRRKLSHRKQKTDWS